MNYSIPLYEEPQGRHYFKDVLKQGKYPCRNVVETGFLENGDFSVAGAAGATTDAYFSPLVGVVSGAITNINPNQVFFGNLRMSIYCSAHSGGGNAVGTIALATRKNNAATLWMVEQRDYVAVSPNPLPVSQYQYLNVQFDLLYIQVQTAALVTATIRIEYLFNGLVIAYY